MAADKHGPEQHEVTPFVVLRDHPVPLRGVAALLPLWDWGWCWVEQPASGPRMSWSTSTADTTSWSF